MIESLSEIGLIELLQTRNIKIDELSSRVKSRKDGRIMELDFLLTNDKELVVREVKRTLKIQDVKDFLEDL